MSGKLSDASLDLIEDEQWWNTSEDKKYECCVSSSGDDYRRSALQHLVEKYGPEAILNEELCLSLMRMIYIKISGF